MKNRFFNPDKSLANRGWDDMRKTLDREMPQKRKRRRFFWLWWLLPAALLTGGAAAYWQTTRPATSVEHPAKPSETAPKPTGPVAYAPASVPADRQITAAGSGFPAMGPRVGANHTRQLAIRSGVRPPAQLPAQTPMQPAATGSPDFSATPQNSFAEKTEIQFNTTATAQLPNWPPTLSLLPVGPFPVEAKEPVFPDVQRANAAAAVARHRDSRWDFGLTAAANTNNFKGLNGGSLGFTTDLRLSRRWGLRSGVAYGYEKLPLASQAIVNAPAVYDTLANDGFVIVEDVIAPTTGSYTNYVAAEVYTQVSAIHRLEMPVLVWWQPHRQWRLYGGGALAHTIHVETGRRTAAINYPEPYQNQISDPNNRLDYLANQRVRRWQTSLVAGAGFKPTWRFEFGMQAQFLPDGVAGSKQSAQFDSGSYAQTPTSNGLGPLWRFHLNATLFF